MCFWDFYFQKMSSEKWHFSWDLRIRKYLVYDTYIILFLTCSILTYRLVSHVDGMTSIFSFSAFLISFQINMKTIEMFFGETRKNRAVKNNLAEGHAHIYTDKK